MKYRSSRPEMFCKKSALKIFGKFTGKKSVRESVFQKLQKFSIKLPEILLKKRLR